MVMKLTEALERLKPWQRRVIGAAIIVFAGIPLVLEYGHQYFSYVHFEANTLKMMLPLYIAAMAAWWLGIWLFVSTLEEHLELMGDAIGTGLLILVNCFLIINLFPEKGAGRPLPDFAVLGAFWIPVAGSIVHFLAGLLLVKVRWAVKLRIDTVLKVAVVIVWVGYMLSVADYFVYEKYVNETLGWEQVDLYRFLMAEAAGLTMLLIMIGWFLKLHRWSWGELESQ